MKNAAKSTTLIVALLVVFFTWLTPTKVADQCVTEASFAVSECACTVLNRVKAGWQEKLVLGPYISTPGNATPAQVQIATDVMSGDTYCDPDFYYMLGGGDYRNPAVEPAGVVKHGQQSIWLYPREAWRELQK